MVVIELGVLVNPAFPYSLHASRSWLFENLSRIGTMKNGTLGVRTAQDHDGREEFPDSEAHLTLAGPALRIRSPLAEHIVAAMPPQTLRGYVITSVSHGQ